MRWRPVQGRIALRRVYDDVIWEPQIVRADRDSVVNTMVQEFHSQLRDTVLSHFDRMVEGFWQEPSEPSATGQLASAFAGYSGDEFCQLDEACRLAVNGSRCRQVLADLVIWGALGEYLSGRGLEGFGVAAFEEVHEVSVARLAAFLSGPWAEGVDFTTEIAFLEGLLDRMANEVGWDPEDLAFGHDLLAFALVQCGSPDLAASHLQRSLEIRGSAFGPSDLRTVRSVERLAELHGRSGNTEQAILLFEEAALQTELLYGALHPQTLTAGNALVQAYSAAGKTWAAQFQCSLALEIRLHELGTDHPETIAARDQSAICFHQTGQVSRAIDLFQENLRAQEGVLGADHPDTMRTRDALARIFEDQDRFADAVPLLEKNLSILEGSRGIDDPEVCMVRDRFEGTCGDARDFARLIPYLDQTLKAFEVAFGTRDPRTVRLRKDLAFAYEEAGDYAAAIHLRAQILADLEETLGPRDPDTPQAMGNLAYVHELAGDEDTARELLERRSRLESEAE